MSEESFYKGEGPREGALQTSGYSRLSGGRRDVRGPSACSGLESAQARSGAGAFSGGSSLQSLLREGGKDNLPISRGTGGHSQTADPAMQPCSQQHFPPAATFRDFQRALIASTGSFGHLVGGRLTHAHTRRTRLLLASKLRAHKLTMRENDARRDDEQARRHVDLDGDERGRANDDGGSGDV